MLVAVGKWGTDAVTLFLEVPALVAALALYRPRFLRGTIALAGILGWLLYYLRGGRTVMSAASPTRGSPRPRR